MTTDTDSAVTLLRCSNLHLNDADSVAILLPILYDLGGRVTLFDFRPEPGYFAGVALSWSSEPGAKIRKNIVKGDETSCPHKRAVITEIRFDRIVRVVTINE